MSIFDDIRAALPWESVVGELGVVMKGRKIPSPFKADKTPSCHLYPDGTFHCFSSGQSGDVITLLAHHYGKKPYEMALELAERLGIHVESSESQKRNQPLYSLMAEAAQWYQGQLGAAALLYLQRRRLTKETFTTWGLGYVPREGGLITHLKRLGATIEQLNAVGLLNSAGREMFRGRLMFPLADKRGRVVGFAGRAMSDDQQPKYLNSPSTRLFHKKRFLYGQPHLKRENYLLLVEGYMDVLSLWQAGYRNTLGVMGTALSQEQITLCGEQKLVLLLDSDAAGQEATKRALLSLKYSADTLIATLPAGKDPDEFIKSGGTLEQLTTTPVHQWLIDAVQVPDQPREREKVARNLLGFVTNTGSPTLDALNKAHLETRFNTASLPPVAKPPQGESNLAIAWEKWAAAYLVNYPFAVAYVNRYFDTINEPPLSQADFALPEYCELVQAVIAYLYAPDAASRELRDWVIEFNPMLQGVIEGLRGINPDLEDLGDFIQLRFAAVLRQQDAEAAQRVARLIDNPPLPDVYPPID